MINCAKYDQKVYTGLTLEVWFVFDWVDVQRALSQCRTFGSGTN